MLILDADKKRHDEALESHPKYAKNERERDIQARRERKKICLTH